MKILHIGLLSHYTKNMTYQENYLIKYNVKSGHNVTFISDVFFYENGSLVKGKEEDILMDEGFRLIRLDYDFFINHFLTKKIQKVSKLIAYIEEIDPDVILYHGCCGYELLNVNKYINQNKSKILYIDSHEDFNNTAKTFFSKLFYKYIHGHFIKKVLPNVEKLLYITEETKNYLEEMYNIKSNKLELFPLGGEIPNENYCIEMRNKLIRKYKLSKDAIIIAHTGKMTKEKKTIDVIKAFSSINQNNFVLLIAGKIIDNKEEIDDLIKRDSRIHNLGWIDNEGLINLLSGCDIYIQPGTQSATLQNALCCDCLGMVYPHLSYVSLFNDKVLYIKNVQDITKCFEKISKDLSFIFMKKKECYEFAKSNLDYRKLSERITRKTGENH